MAQQTVAALGWVPTQPRCAWCPTSNLLALEASVAPGDAAVFVLDPSCPKARSLLILRSCRRLASLLHANHSSCQDSESRQLHLG